MNDGQLDQAIADAISLMERVRDYLMEIRRNDPFPKDAAPMIRLETTRFSSQLANLLANSLAWLMWCKAIGAGEISLEEFTEKTGEFCELTKLEAPSDEIPREMTAIALETNILLERSIVLAAKTAEASETP